VLSILHKNKLFVESIQHVGSNPTPTANGHSELHWGNDKSGLVLEAAVSAKHME